MNTEQTAQQLRLAATILETGYPWEHWHISDQVWTPAGPDDNVSCFASNPTRKIRLALATPPDNRPLHNPDNLTAEQVGAGWRLALKGENAHEGEIWTGMAWSKNHVCTYVNEATFRLPLSVPWPEPQPDPYAELKKAHAEGKVIQVRVSEEVWEERDTLVWDSPPECYRIKSTTTFQLPPPPPGMQWHRTDGWEEGDLPQGWRPFHFGESSANPDYSNVTDQVRDLSSWRTLTGGEIATATCCLLRTRRPLTFTHAGKQWTWHRVGEPMPCDGEARIEIISLLGKTTSDDGTLPLYPRAARSNIWEQTLGWRYADETKTVPLGPEDVPPCSVFSVKGKSSSSWHQMKICPQWDSVFFGSDISVSYEELMRDWFINRSIPLTGKWNPDAWEPCHKEIDA